MMARSEVRYADTGSARVDRDRLADHSDVAMDSVYARRDQTGSGPVICSSTRATIRAALRSAVLPCVGRGAGWESNATGMEYTAMGEINCC